MSSLRNEVSQRRGFSAGCQEPPVTLIETADGGRLCMRSTTRRLAVRLLGAIMVSQGNGYEEGRVYTKGFSSAEAVNRNERRTREATRALRHYRP